MLWVGSYDHPSGLVIPHNSQHLADSDTHSSEGTESAMKKGS